MENNISRTRHDVDALKKWLRLILVFSIAELTCNHVIPASFGWKQWTQYSIHAAALYCFFHLMKENRFYYWTVLCMIVELIAKAASHLATTVFLADLIRLFPGQEIETVLSTVTMPLSVVMLVTAFLGYIFELWGHSNLTKPFDEGLARKWKMLFVWNWSAGMLASAMGYLFTYLHKALAWDFAFYQGVHSLVNLPTFAIKVLYMLYLWRTIEKITWKEESVDGN